MVQFYKKVAISAAIALASTGSAFALGLGEVSWKSTLNQPLNAEIVLYDLRNIAANELVVELASIEAFEKAGLERPHFLTDLVFTPVIKNGKGVIKITSNNPIKEPYLDFLLSVSWSSGKTLREYTLLIDPPTYKPTKVIPTIAPRKTTPPPKEVTIATPPKKDILQKPATTAVTNVPAKESSGKGGQGGNLKVVAGDSLWKIASRNRGNASIHQAMLSIYQENKDAFIDGDMNRLKRGKVLRIPNAEQMRTQTRSEALAQVLQNINNKGKMASRQVAASKTPQQNAPVKTPVDELTLVAPKDPANVTNNTATGQTSDRLLSELAIKKTEAEENLDAVTRKNEELRNRMEDLQSQLTSIKGIIKLRDNQLASLQANIAKQTQKKPITDQQKQDDEIGSQAEPTTSVQ